MCAHTQRRRLHLGGIERLEARELLADASTSIAEYSIPTAASAPIDVALGSDHALWITESAGNKIARYDPTKSSFNEYTVPTVASAPYRIKPGEATDPNLYFTENQGGKLGRITPAGQISDTPVTDANGIPIAGSPLVDLAYDPLGDNFYVSQSNVPQVGIFDVGDFLEYQPVISGQFRPTASAANSSNWGVAFGHDLTSPAVYFSERDADKIGVFELDSQGNLVTHEYTLPTGTRPLYIVQGPDQSFWFTESGTGKIGRIDRTTRAITEYAPPTPNSQPWGIAASNDKIYFTESSRNQIGRIAFDVDDKPTITEVPLGVGVTPKGITVGGDGNVWFAEENGNKLGLFFGDGSNRPAYTFGSPVALPAAAGAPLGLTAAPDGNLYAYTYNAVTIAEGIARIAVMPSPSATYFPAPYTFVGGGPYGGGWLATGYDGNLWASSLVAGQYGQSSLISTGGSLSYGRLPDNFNLNPFPYTMIVTAYVPHIRP